MKLPATDRALPRSGPWKYYYGSTSIWTANDHHAICVMMGPRKALDLKEANANLIIRAVNSHDALVSTATSLIASLDPDTLNPEQFNAWSDLSAALSLAGEKQ